MARVGRETVVEGFLNFEIGQVNSNLEHHACQDLVVRVAKVTVAEVMASDRITTPIIISGSSS
jgi:hypothetical protein